MTAQEQARDNFKRTVHSWTLATLREQYLKQADYCDRLAQESEARRRMLVELGGQCWLSPEEAAQIEALTLKLAESIALPGTITHEELHACGVAIANAIQMQQRRNPQHDPNPAAVPEAGASHEVASGPYGDGDTSIVEVQGTDDACPKSAAVPVATAAEEGGGG